jgi:hypothetical protein
MARKIIDIGVTGNDATGDSIRESFRKVNDNFQELYAVFGVGGQIAFTTLSDTPDTLVGQQNKIPIVNNDGTALDLRAIIGARIDIDTSAKYLDYETITGGIFLEEQVITGSTSGATASIKIVQSSIKRIYITSLNGRAFQNGENIVSGGVIGSNITNGTSVLFENNSSRLFDDPAPRMKSAMNAGTNIIGNLGEPSPDVVGEFNSVYGLNATTINNIAIPKGYADQRYLLKGFEKTIAAISRTNPVSIRTLEPHRLDRGDKVLINNLIGSVELEGRTFFVEPTDSDEFSLFEDSTLLTPVDGTTHTPFQGGGRVLFKTKDFITNPVEVPSGATGAEIPQVQEVVTREGSIENRTMRAALFLHDHPGSLSGAGTPNGADDLQAATKYYVDNSSYASTINLYVSTSGDDAQLKTPAGKEGRAPAYAFRSINKAAQKAEEIIRDSLPETGPYKQAIAYGGGAAFSEISFIIPNNDDTGTVRIYFTNNGGARVDQGDPGNTDLRPGKIVTGRTSGARGIIYLYYGEATVAPYTGNDFFDVTPITGEFILGENIEYDQPVAETNVSIIVESGTYYEDFPIRLATNVSLYGDEFRRVLIRPADRPSQSPWSRLWFYRDTEFDGLQTADTNYGYHYLTDPYDPNSEAKNNRDLDVFLCNDAVIIRQITCQGHGGFMMVLDPEGQILTKSPYFQQGSSFAQSLNKQAFRGGQYVDGFTGNLPATVVDTIETGGEIKDIVVSYTQRPVQTPTSFVVQGSQFTVNTFRPNGEGNQNASELLKRNRDFIAEQTIGYIENELIFDYDKIDWNNRFKNIIAAIENDVLRGGNQQSRSLALTYWENVTSVIDGKINEFVSGLEHLKDILPFIISNNAMVYPYQTDIPQTSSPIPTLSAGNNLAVTRSNLVFKEILDILVNGAPASDTILYPSPIGVDSNKVNAKDRLRNNRAFLQAEVIAWVGVNYPALSIDTEKCARDIGYVIDAISYDLLYGGNSASVRAADAYYLGVTSYIGPGETASTVGAYNYLASVVSDVVLGNTVTPTVIGPNPNTQSQDTSGSNATSTEASLLDQLIQIVEDVVAAGNTSGLPTITYPDVSWVDEDVLAARSLLIANKNDILDKTIEYIENSFDYLIGNYNESKCRRDTGIAIDAAIYDLALGTNYNAVTAGLAYTRGNTEYLQSEQKTETVRALNYAGALSSSYMLFVSEDEADKSVLTRIEELIDVIKTIITLDPFDLTNVPTVEFNNVPSTDLDLVAAYNGFVANRDFLANEVIGHINDKYFVTYDRDKCRRDTKLIIDALVHDILYTGNLKTAQAADRYLLPSSAYVLSRYQNNETSLALEYAKAIASLVVVNSTIPLTQNRFSQYKDSLLSGGGSSTAEITRLMNIVIGAIQNGKSYIEARAIVDAAISDVQTSVIDFLNTTYSVTVTASNATNDRFTCSSTANLRVNFPIKFTGTVFGGITENTTYYILDIPVAGQFRIKERLESVVPVELTTATGTMTGSLSYNETTCSRDVGIIANSIANDFIGGDLQATRAGFRYRAGTAFVVIEEQAIETIAAINHLRDELVDLFEVGSEFRTKIIDSAEIITNIITDINLAPENVYPKYQLVLDEATLFYKPVTATNVNISTIVDDNEIVCTVPTANIVGGDLLKGLKVSGENLPNGGTISFVDEEAGTTTFIIRLRSNVDYTGTSSGSLTFTPPDEITLLTPGNVSMCSNDFTQINDLGYGLVANNNGLIEAVSVFTYYCWTAYFSNNGGQIRSLNGSNTNGEYGLVAAGSDPLEVPDDVILANDMQQSARVYKKGIHITDNSQSDSAVYVVDLDYVPYNISEIEIVHPGYGIVRYEISNAQDVSADDNILVSSFTSKTGTGPYLVTFAIPVQSTAPITNVNYVVTGNSNNNYNGTFNCTASTTTSITLSYPTDPGVYGTGNTRVYRDKWLFKLNLSTAGNNETATTGLKASLVDNQVVGIRGNQNFKFREILETQPTRPSTALTFTADPQVDPVYRVIAYDNVGPVIGELALDEAVLTFDTSYKYIKLVVDTSNATVTDPDNPSKTLGSKVGDVKISVSALDVADTNRINTGQMLITWYGKKHLVTSYTSTPGLNYVEISDIDLDGNPYPNKNLTGAVATGLQFPVISGEGYPVSNFVSKTGAGPYLVTFAIPEQDIAPTTGVNYTVVRSGTSAYNATVSATASTTTSITLSYPTDPGVFSEGDTDTIIYLDSEKYNTDLLLGETATIRAGLSEKEPGEIVVRISTMRATGHDFLDIGTGGYNQSNYPSKIYGAPRAPDQGKEVDERTRGRVFYVSTDQDGFFRVGRFFTVDQGTGTVTFAASIALSNLDGIGFKRGVTVSEFSNDDTMIDRATDTVPTESAVTGYLDRRLGIDINGATTDTSRLLGSAQLRFLDNKNINKIETNFNVNGFRIQNIALNPVSDNEAASKFYVDDQQLSDEKVDTETVTKAQNNILVWNAASNKWVNSEASTTGDISITLNNSTQAVALDIKAGVIVNADVNASAAIAQSKLALNAATTRANATGITQADRGLASFNSSQFTLTNGWVDLQTSTSTTTGVTLNKIQQIANGTVLGNRSGSTTSPSLITPADVVLDGDGVKNAYFTSSTGDLVFQKTGADVIGGAMTIVLNGKEVCRASGGSWSAVGSAVTSLTINLPASGITGIGSIDSGQVVTKVSGTGVLPPNSTVTSYNSTTGTLIIQWPIAQTVAAGSGFTFLFTANGPDYGITNITTTGAAHSLVKTDAEGAINLGSLKIDGYLVADTAGGSSVNFYTPGGGGTGLNANFLTASGTTPNISVRALGSFTAEVDDAATNAVTYSLTSTHTTTGTPAIGIGSGLRFIAETSAGNTEIGATIDAITTTITSGNEAFDLVFRTMSGGTAASEKVRITSTGNTILQGDLDVRGGDITTNQTTFNLIDTTATTVNLAGSATTFNVGYDGTLGSATNISTGATQSGQTKTINIGTGGAASSTTTINIGSAAGGTITLSNPIVSITAGTDSTNSSTGALVVTGGVGIGEDLNIGEDLSVVGNTVLGGNDTTTITINGQFVTGTRLKTGKTSTNTFNLSAYDVDGAAYADLITLTAGNTPTLTIVSTGVGSINNMSIGATTRSTGAFTTLTSNGATTFTANTASTSTTTGTLVVTGGVGVSGAIYAGSIQATPIGSTTRSTGAFTTLTSNGATTFTANTASTSTTTGTLVVTGGVGVSGTVYAGGFNGALSGNVTGNVNGNITTTSITTGAAATAGTIVGNWSLGSGSQLRATFADLAENYVADKQYEPGTVLEFGGDFEVTIAEDETRRVAGVVTTNPAYIMNNDCVGEHVVCIALQGRVPVKVRGKVRKGDLLVSGGNGFARPTTDPKIGTIIGKALENFDGEGVIEVAVGRL